MSARRDLHPTMRIRKRMIVPYVASLVTATALLFGSCVENATEPTDPTDPTGPVESLTDFAGTASEPIAGSLLAVSSLATVAKAAAGAADDSVSFVSLQPEALPEADSVQIVNRASGVLVSVLVVDGGFDPVTIPATVGDTLEIVPFKANVPQPSFRAYVPARRPPVVVRTDPPNRKTKVPLNASMVVVFSEPIASGTVTVTNIRLLKDGQLVPADFSLDAERLRVEIRPDVPLSPQTDYTLVIDTGVTDLSGDSLEQRAEVTFSTIEATLSITPQGTSIVVGLRLQFTARLVNARGEAETVPPITWSSSDSSVAAVSPTGMVTGIAEGVATIRATIQGQEAASTVTVVASSGTTIVELTAGGSHTCGLTAAGLAYCWGSNEYGQLGDGAGGAAVSQLLPVPVTGGHTFAMLAAGTHHTCGLTDSGTVMCWGRNDQGQLGDGSQANHDTPAPVAGSELYVAVTAGLDHTCARTAGDTYCWGQNVGTALGDFEVAVEPHHVDVQGSLTWAPIDFQARRGTRQNPINTPYWCPLIVNAGALFCWGQPPEGRAALDLATLSIPYGEGAFPRVVHLALDAMTNCTVTVGGGAYCTRRFTFEAYYGPEAFDFEHENGLGVEVCDVGCKARGGFDVSYWYIDGHSSLGRFSLPSGAGIVVNGQFHSCALTPEGEAHCWGAAYRGQVGRPVTEADLAHDPARWEEGVAVPDPVAGSLRFATLAAGDEHTCGVTWSGVAYCWGANTFGQLGDATQTDRDVPVQVSFQD